MEKGLFGYLQTPDLIERIQIIHYVDMS